jgi:hypothetical protein
MLPDYTSPSSPPRVSQRDRGSGSRSLGTFVELRFVMQGSGLTDRGAVEQHKDRAKLLSAARVTNENITQEPSG